MVSNGQNTPKISLLDVITQIFAKQFSANSLNFRFQSFDCASHSFVKLFGQFQEFSNLIFGGFLLFGPTVGRPGRPQFLKQPNDP